MIDGLHNQQLELVPFFYFAFLRSTVRAMVHAKRKRVERVGYEQSNSLPLPTIWIVGHRDLPIQRAEVVGSTPTRSIIYCCTTTVLI
jgi:hypothetical protein